MKIFSKKNVINITNVEGEKNKDEIKSLIYEIFENYINYESINIERSGHISLPKKEKDIIKNIFSLNFDDYHDILKIWN